ncbi:MAG: DNA-binding protein WhiA [Clostridiales bacterium]|nr:MAG: DNA-binding protein WhiA [Clostridiales bacterium]HJA31975.1 DNA-binding protein WhiA [Candidatus Eisenbergiella pullicola]
MSFSSKVKEELYRHVSTARHCQLAELAAILHFCGSIGGGERGNFIQIRAENVLVVRKSFTLLQKTFNISTETKVQHEENGSAYFLKIPDQEVGKRILQSTRFLDSDGRLVSGLRDPVNRMIIKNACCQRAFLRGAFLCVGSMSDPGKGYHLELVCGLQPQALQLQELLAGFEIEARIVRRKKYFVVYIKEGAGISDFLNVTEAHVALMEFENSRVVRDVRNTVNRRVNCETANIAKTVNAAARQVEDILWLQQKYGLENLPDGLRQMAQVRLEHPDAPLKELGTYLDPPVGKSGVNHRLRKLCELADSIRL